MRTNAKRDVDFVERHAGLLGCELCEDCVGTCPDILGGAGDADRAIVAELDVRLGSKASSDPGTSGHSPPERETVALHRADLRCAPRPAELLRAKLKALEQMAGGERKTQTLIDFWFIQDAQLHGIDLEQISKFIHRRFGGVEARHGAWPPHVDGCTDVTPSAPKCDAEVRNAVLGWRCLAAILVVIVQHRAIVDVVVL